MGTNYYWTDRPTFAMHLTDDQRQNLLVALDQVRGMDEQVAELQAIFSGVVPTAASERVHIGKSSGGWCFSLRVYPDGGYPDHGIRDLNDWRERFARPGSRIVDEYDRDVTPAEMFAVITERSNRRGSGSMFDYAANGAEPGPNGLVRHRIDGRCIGHGAGTWDMIVGEFS